MKQQLLYFFVFILFQTSLLKGQEVIETIAPDRPGYGDAVSIVPLKNLQVETGFWFEQDKASPLTTSGLGLNSTLFRYGVGKNIELRLDYNLWQSRIKSSRPRTPEVSETGLFPFRVGMKGALTENSGWVPSITFIGMLGLPWSATNNFRPGYLSPDLQLSFANQVTDWLSICYNLGSSWDGDNPNPQNYYALSTEFSLSEKLGAYVQGRGSFQTTREAGKVSTEHLLYTEAGVVFYPKPNIQIDLSSGFKVAEYATEWISINDHSYFFVSTGLSWRFPR